MKNIQEDNRKIKYQIEVDGQIVNIYYQKDSKRIIVTIGSNILSQENYLLNTGNIYKEIVSNIQDFSNITFEFYPVDNTELAHSQEVIKEFGITNSLIIAPDITKKSQMIESFFNANIISKNSNGKIINYVVRESDANSEEYILEDIDIDDLKIELGELLRDGNINIDSLDEKTITNILLDRMSNKRKQHQLNSSDQYEAKNEYEQASLNATNQDDLVNTEIGIIKRNPYDDGSNSYRTVERDGDSYNAVNPSVQEVSSISSEISDPDLTRDETESREDEKIYYVDRYTGDIYNQEEEKIGNLNEGYIINEENHLLLNGKDLGVIDEKTRAMERENVKVKKLVKPNNTDFGIINIKAFTTIMLVFVATVVLYLVLYLNK